MSNRQLRRIPQVAPEAIEAELARRDLRTFTHQAWPLVIPGRPMLDNWHLDVIFEHLEAVTRGEIRQLVINIPPRHMKSLTTSVFWPAWAWLTNPETQFLFASHGADLALRDAKRARRLMESRGIPDAPQGFGPMQRVGYRGYLDLFGDPWYFTSDENVMGRYSNDQGGYRISTGIGGGATGEGGDVVVIDDPHKLEESDSEAKRDQAIAFVTETVPSRLNTPEAATVVIMQRVHEADATGAILEEQGWTHLCLPMEFEPEHPYLSRHDQREADGEVLWPERFPEQRVERLKEIGSYKYAGQYQQLPAPSSGGVFQRDWFQLYELGRHGQIQRLTVSWDMAFKDNEDADYVVGQVWSTDLADRYLLGQLRARLDFPATEAAVKAMAEWVIEQSWAHAGHLTLVEDKANGPAIIAALKKKLAGMVAVNPEGGKLARAHAVAPQVESGNVYLPRGYIPAPPGYELTPTDAFIEEAAGFPRRLHDDQVDAMSQALLRLARAPSSKRKIRSGSVTRGSVA